MNESDVRNLVEGANLDVSRLVIPDVERVAIAMNEDLVVWASYRGEHGMLLIRVQALDEPTEAEYKAGQLLNGQWLYLHPKGGIGKFWAPFQKNGVNFFRVGGDAGEYTLSFDA